MTREERVARNSVLFREVNERIVEGAERAGFAGPTFFVCECGNTECSETVEVRFDEYQQARENSTIFLVSPGHEAPDFELQQQPPNGTTPGPELRELLPEAEYRLPFRDAHMTRASE